MASSGTMTGNSVTLNGNSGNYFYITWSVSSQNTVQRRSTVQWAAYFHFVNADAQLSNGSASLNGTRWSVSGTVHSNQGNYTTRDILLSSGSFTVQHDSDGEATLSVSGGVNVSGAPRSEGSNSWSLPDIPLFPGPPTGLTSTGHNDSNPTTATFSWEAPEVVGSGLTHWRLEIADSPLFTFTSLVWDDDGTWDTEVDTDGLPRNTILYARVRARSSAGYGDWSEVYVFSTGVTAPSAPAAPSVNASGTTLSISWDAPTNNGGLSILGYRVQRATNSGFSSGLVEYDVSATPRTLQVTGLAQSTTHYVRVRARNSEGSGSYSTAASATTGSATPSAPGAPEVSSLSPSSVSVDWDPPSSDGGSSVTSYDVQRATNSGFTQGVVTASGVSGPHTFAGLTPTVTYYFRVRARNASGTGPYSSVTSHTTISGVKVGDGTNWVDANLYIGSAGLSWVPTRVRSGSGGSWV